MDSRFAERRRPEPASRRFAQGGGQSPQGGALREEVGSRCRGESQDLADMDVVIHREREVKGEAGDGTAVKAETEACGTAAGDMVGAGDRYHKG